ncbi:hypothetical protein DUI87_34804 [Hirundo rustica rustica]|uniref:ribonuclease H n=1 Tax=Hirundo rustica rustica TaxID=333673 RepID=A0A3M0J2H0_HIRRU|nr:hypothetical protein DUI87_34804 [Hirundo rustica rustica]
MNIGVRICEVIGAEGKPFTASIIEGVEVRGNSRQVVADFIYLPDLGSNLLGRDLQVQLGVGVVPEEGRMKVKIMKLTIEDLEKINPEVWAEEGKSGLLNITPIKIEMQLGTSPIRVRQYPISIEGKKGLAPIIRQLLEEGILEPCMSSHNTPILAVKKAEGKYRLVQDLREINKRTITKHPIVPNPYTLLSQIPREHAWFTIIDLKDAFWACPLAEESRDWFAFEWEHPETKRKQQLRWTRLPQGFTESPNLFGQALEGLLEQFTPEGRVQILQYVDDLLISGEEQIELWIDEYTQSVKFLYGKLTNPEPIEWTQEDENQLKDLKDKLSTAPVLSLPDLKKEFDLFVNTEGGVAYGVIAQEWGGCKKPIAFLSKLLDPVARGWPTCIQAIAATAMLVEETQKLTLHGKIRVHTPHDIKTILSQKAPGWVTDSRILKYEITLMNSENLSLTTSKNPNPAQFLSGEPPLELEHDCSELVSFQTKVREDLESVPLPYGRKLFTDGSSRVLDGKRISGYAIVEGLATENLKVLEKGKLPSSWSAQLCEIYAVKRGLDLLEGDQGTIYTDSKYAYGVVHTFGKIWEERGYLNSKGRDLIHKEMIKSVLTSLMKPIEIAIVHVKGHQRGNTFEEKGNQVADQEAKGAAQDPKEPIKILALGTTPERGGEEEEPKYDKAEVKIIEELKMQKGEHGEWLTPDGRKFLNRPLARKILTEIHELTHWGTQGVCDHFLRENFRVGAYSLAKAITQGGLVHRIWPRLKKDRRRDGRLPFGPPGQRQVGAAWDRQRGGALEGKNIYLDQVPIAKIGNLPPQFPISMDSSQTKAARTHESGWPWLPVGWHSCAFETLGLGAFIPNEESSSSCPGTHGQNCDATSKMPRVQGQPLDERCQERQEKNIHAVKAPMAKMGIPPPKLHASKDCSQVKAARTDRSGGLHGQSEEMSNSSSISHFLLLALADTWQLQLLHFCLFLGISLAALLGNGLIISAVACGHLLHTPMFFFLLNLALTDLGSICTTVPKAMHNSLWTPAEYFLLTIMCYDRYVSICKPLHYGTLLGSRACAHMAAAAWASAFLNALMHTADTFSLPLCHGNVLGQFFCEIPQILKLSCSKSYLRELGLIAHYNVCSSEAPFISSPSLDLAVSVLYSVVPPALNPLIYSLRNQELKAAVWRLMTGWFRIH